MFRRCLQNRIALGRLEPLEVENLIHTRYGICIDTLLDNRGDGVTDWNLAIRICHRVRRRVDLVIPFSCMDDCGARRAGPRLRTRRQ